MQNNLAGVDRVIELLDTPVAQVALVRARPPEAARVEFDRGLAILGDADAAETAAVEIAFFFPGMNVYSR